MLPFPDPVRRAYALVAARALPRLMFASAIACGVLAVRLYLSRDWSYAHMLWNLILAWVPYALALLLLFDHRRGIRSWRLLPVGALWLLWLPNAPYLVTEFVHLAEYRTFALWYDVGMIALFAWLGCVLAVQSLAIVGDVVRERRGSSAAWLCVGASIGLSGFGVYLGRFRRWNSWDVVRDPHGLFFDIAERVLHPLDHPRTVGMTLLFAAILLVCYLTLNARCEVTGGRRKSDPITFAD